MCVCVWVSVFVSRCVRGLLRSVRAALTWCHISHLRAFYSGRFALSSVDAHNGANNRGQETRLQEILRPIAVCISSSTRCTGSQSQLCYWCDPNKLSASLSWSTSWPLPRPGWWMMRGKQKSILKHNNIPVNTTVCQLKEIVWHFRKNAFSLLKWADYCHSKVCMLKPQPVAC